MSSRKAINLERMKKVNSASASSEDTKQPQKRTVVAMAGKLRVSVEGRKNG